MRKKANLWLLLLFFHPGVLPASTVAEKAFHPGELGMFMAGAQVALSGGAEALWYNPAGLAQALAQRLTFSGFGFDIHSLSNETEKKAQWNFGKGYAGISRKTESQKWGFGFFLAQPQNEKTFLEKKHNTTTNDFPEDITFISQSSPLDIFPSGGVESASYKETGSFQEIHLGGALAYAASRDMRFGLGFRLERITFNKHYTLLRQLGAVEGETASLFSQILEEGRLVGSANQLRISLGMQLKISSGMALGLTHLTKGNSIQAKGSVEERRAHTYSLIEPQLILVENSNLRQIDASNSGFAYQKPAEWSLGVALLGDDSVLELDVFYQLPLEAYALFPTKHNHANTNQRRNFPLRLVRKKQTLGFSLGYSWEIDQGKFWLVGLSQQKSGYTSEEQVFHPLSTSSLRFGRYTQKEAASFSWGMVYRLGSAESTLAEGMLSSIESEYYGLFFNASYLL